MTGADLIGRLPIRAAHAGNIDEIGVLAAGEQIVRPLMGSLSQSDVLFVRGWAIDLERQSPASGVIMSLGTATNELEYGAPRPDIAKALGSDTFLSCGFRGCIAAGADVHGRQELRLLGLGHDGHGVFPIGAARQLNVVPGLVAVALPGLRTGAFTLYHIDRGRRQRLQRGDTLEINGWAYDRNAGGPIRGVFLIVDNSHIVHGAIGRSRPDVAAHLRDEARISSGFLIRLDTTGITPGGHRLRLGFLNADGTLHEVFELERLEIRSFDPGAH